jgi:membrane-bound metal-dependent hydrolase YbcI (DUF457 family)
MPGYRKHLTFALFSFPLVTLSYKIITLFSKGTSLTWEMIGIGFVLYSISAEAPDVDHKQAYANSIFRFLLWVMISLLTFKYLYTEYYYCLPVFYERIIEEVFLIISIIGGFGVSMLILKLLPVHRGPMHTLWFAILYAFLIAVGYWYLWENGGSGTKVFSTVLFIFLCAFFGYINHLLLDAIVTASNKKRSSRKKIL